MLGRGLVLAAALALTLLPGAVRADGAWLDRTPVVQWNHARLDVPKAPPNPDFANTNPQCLSDQQHRPAETDEDRAVVQAGWILSGTYDSGWGLRVVTGANGFDGMCRPLGYQQFVFVGGVFAGTVSPTPMDSRTDGAGDVRITGPGKLSGSFSRYTAMDALCCPSRSSFVQYTIDLRSGAPVLMVSSVFTNATS